MKKKDSIIKGIVNSVLPVILAFAFGAIIIAAIGESPLETYGVLIRKSLLTEKGFMNTLHYASPLILTGLAIAITFKANLYNMGVEGQMLLGGFFAGITGAYLNISNPFISKLICFLVAIVCGMLFALIPAILNYAVSKTLEFLTTGVFKDKSAGYVATPTIKENVMFKRFGASRMTMFFVIAMIILVIMYFVMKKSKLGYEITAIGRNPEFAEATGMNVGKKIIIMMLISGALSGVAGAGWMLSDQFKYTLTFSANPGLGWDGMLIALLGGHSPIGILIAAIFYAALKTGSDSINMYTAVPKEIVAIIQGMIILFLAVKFIGDKTSVFSRFKKAKKEDA